MVAYQPRRFDPMDATSVLTKAQVLADLQLLRSAGFNGILTYSARGLLGMVPQLARETGFSGTIIQGVWNLESEEEWDRAVAQSAYVDGYCLGNEGLGIRYEVAGLSERMETLRAVTGKPVTTSEPIDSYLEGEYCDWLRECGDWLFPLAHPYWASVDSADEAIEWIAFRYYFLQARATVPVVLKELGWPTVVSTSYDEQSQSNFFDLAREREFRFFYFEAFDQPWKRTNGVGPDVEAHWGLFRDDGTAKEAVECLLK
jgi:exo-beta-1,3-glucanase (GH17 family)